MPVIKADAVPHAEPENQCDQRVAQLLGRMQVKAAANTARHDYASSANPRGDEVGNPEQAYGDVLRMLQALANSRNGTT